jgi:hypothetical protein
MEDGRRGVHTEDGEERRSLGFHKGGHKVGWRRIQPAVGSECGSGWGRGRAEACGWAYSWQEEGVAPLGIRVGIRVRIGVRIRVTG